MAEARDNARAEVRAILNDRGPRAYSGETPRMIDGRSPFEARQVGWNTRVSIGRTERRGKKGSLKLIRPHEDAGAPKHGGARLPAGEWLDRSTGEPRVAFTSAIVATTAVARRDAIRCGGGPVTVLRGDDDAPINDTDPGDDERTTLERAYWARIHTENAK